MPQVKSGVRRDRGAVAVEFALVIPVLLLILFGVMDFGRAMFVKNALTNAAAQAARVASVHSAVTSNSESATVQAVASQVATQMGIQSMAGATGSVSVVKFTLCPPDTATTASAAVASVTTGVGFSWMLPRDLFNPGAGSDSITATATWLCVFTK